MRYKIGDVEKILGVPPVTTRFFERKGIIRAHRAENGYRYYETFDLNKLFTYRVYRSLEFSLDEALELVDGNSLDNLSRRMEEQTLAVEERQRQLARIQRRLEYFRNLLGRVPQEEGQLTEQTMPRITFIQNQARDEFLLGGEVLRATRHCFDVMEACLPMYHYSLADEREIRYGYGVLSDIDASDVLLSRGEALGGQPCLHTILRQTSGQSKKVLLAPLLEHIAPERLKRLTGEAFGHVFHEEKSGGQVFWYSELWLPLRQ